MSKINFDGVDLVALLQRAGPRINNNNRMPTPASPVTVSTNTTQSSASVTYSQFAISNQSQPKSSAGVVLLEVVGLLNEIKDFQQGEGLANSNAATELDKSVYNKDLSTRFDAKLVELTGLIGEGFELTSGDLAIINVVIESSDMPEPMRTSALHFVGDSVRKNGHVIQDSTFDAMATLLNDANAPTRSANQALMVIASAAQKGQVIPANTLEAIAKYLPTNDNAVLTYHFAGKNNSTFPADGLSKLAESLNSTYGDAQKTAAFKGFILQTFALSASSRTIPDDAAAALVKVAQDTNATLSHRNNAIIGLSSQMSDKARNYAIQDLQELKFSVDFNSPLQKTINAVLNKINPNPLSFVPMSRYTPIFYG